MIKKWKKLGKFKTLFSRYGKFLRQEFFINPKTGVKEEYIMVGEGNSVGILGITKDKKVILTKQFKQAAGKVLVEIPAGVIDKGESPLAAARREFEEETGYAGDIKQIGKFMRSTRSIPSLSYCFLATNCRKLESPTLDDDGGLEVEIRLFKDWLAEIKKGNVLDCLSVVTTLLADDHLKNEK